MFFKKKHFSAPDEAQIVKHIQQAELHCSGEIRVYVESKVNHPDVEPRAIAVFKQLKMHETEHRNGVLIYIAKLDRRFAVLGDHGIHTHVGNPFWKHEAASMKAAFDAGHFVKGICDTIGRIGDKLKEHFPEHDESKKKNELPDSPVYGK